MMKATQKHCGTQAELIACAYLLGEGYDVFRNVSPHGTADLVACKGDTVLRIDVKSGKAPPKFTQEQKAEGIILLHVDEHGHCELDTDRKQRRAKDISSVLSVIDGLSPQDGAQQLNQRGITTPNGAQWSPALVVQMRQRVAI
jgi:hypothetical protein